MYFFNSETSKDNRRQSLAVPSLEQTLGVRRHSVPVNMEPPLPRTIYRRESLPTGRATSQSGRSTVSPIRTESRTSSGLKEEDELLKYGSQASLLSTSSGHHNSSGPYAFSLFKNFRNNVIDSMCSK